MKLHNCVIVGALTLLAIGPANAGENLLGSIKQGSAPADSVVSSAPARAPQRQPTAAAPAPRQMITQAVEPVVEPQEHKGLGAQAMASLRPAPEAVEKPVQAEVVQEATVVRSPDAADLAELHDVTPPPKVAAPAVPGLGAKGPEPKATEVKGPSEGTKQVAGQASTAQQATNVPGSASVPTAPKPNSAPAQSPIVLPAKPAAPAKIELSSREREFQQLESELIRQKRILQLSAEVSELEARVNKANADAYPRAVAAGLPVVRPRFAAPSVLDVPEEMPAQLVSKPWGALNNLSADLMVAGKRATYKVGARIGAYTVREINRDSVVLASGKKTVTLTPSR